MTLRTGAAEQSTPGGTGDDWAAPAMRRPAGVRVVGPCAASRPCHAVVVRRPGTAGRRDGRLRPAADDHAAGRSAGAARSRSRSACSARCVAVGVCRTSPRAGHRAHRGAHRRPPRVLAPDLVRRQLLLLGRRPLRPPRSDHLQPGRPLADGPPQPAHRDPSRAVRLAGRLHRRVGRLLELVGRARSTPRATTCCRCCWPRPASCSALGALLKVNVLFGAMALFVFFGLARRVVGPVWALVAMSTLAVSLPMIYVSRDTFSEPLALLYLMGGLLLLHRAIAYGRLRDFALAGFVAGSAAMARIDTDASLLALIIVLTVLLARAPVGATGALATAGRGCAGRRRRCRRRWAGPTSPGCPAATTTTSARTSCCWSRRRVGAGRARRGRRAARLAPARPGLAARPMRTQRAGDRRLGRRSSVAFAVLASRPLWMHGPRPVTPYLIQVQQQAGDAIDGTRTYNEQTRQLAGAVLRLADRRARRRRLRAAGATAAAPARLRPARRADHGPGDERAVPVVIADHPGPGVGRAPLRPGGDAGAAGGRGLCPAVRSTAASAGWAGRSAILGGGWR